ncbi:hypothetical protein Ct9H90mP29_14190 [bacterium]|nr:MAG: hypothetical protein Ct9H90mP29_14190 [bacterium]
MDDDDLWDQSFDNMKNLTLLLFMSLILSNDQIPGQTKKDLFFTWRHSSYGFR